MGIGSPQFSNKRMALFEYKARSARSEFLKGVVEAPSVHVAEELLIDRGLTIIALSEKKQTLFQSSFGLFNRVPKREILVFSRQLSVMISADIPIVRSLKILMRQTNNIAFKIILSKVSDDVDGGAKLSQALARYPQVFDNFFIQMVRAAETTGRLDETLTYLANQKEKDYELARSIRGSMIYPAFILVGLFAVGIVMMVFVVPRLTDILKETGAPLPIATRMLIFLSAAIQQYWWIAAIVFIFLGILLRLYYKTPQGHERIDMLKIRAPIVGRIFEKIYVTRFSRSLSTLIASGVPIAKALEIVADVVGNEVYRKLTVATIQVVEDGKPMTTILGESKVIPQMLVQILHVGEESGKLDQVLSKLADFYTKEVDASVSNLVTIIEPLVIVVLGVAVGFLIVSILLPLYTLTSSI